MSRRASPPGCTNTSAPAGLSSSVTTPLGTGNGSRACSTGLAWTTPSGTRAAASATSGPASTGTGATPRTGSSSERQPTTITPSTTRWGTWRHSRRSCAWRNRASSSRSEPSGLGWAGIDRPGGGWWAVSMAGPGAFVGREGELSRLVGALGGDARLVLVTGDAGVGKTRFAREGMARAAAGGMLVAWGECLPLARSLPLLPVISALDELARLDGGRVLAAGLDAAPGFVRGEVGRLLPQLGPRSEPGLSGRDGGWEQERLFAAVAELLSAVAAGSGAGVGLVVEDVHWADTETLDLLTFLARPGRRGRVRVVVTCRSDEAPLAGPAASWLARVRSEAGMEEIALGPLSRAETAEQVTALAGGPVP